MREVVYTDSDGDTLTISGHDTGGVELEIPETPFYLAADQLDSFIEDLRALCVEPDPDEGEGGDPE